MKLLIGADTVPTSVTNDLFVKGDIKALFGDICTLAKEADRVIINLECALTKSDGKIKKFGPNIKCDPECTNALVKLGVTDVMLSNNHVFDYGIKGLVDTMEALDKAGLPYTGVGENDTDSRFYFVSVDANEQKQVTVYYLVDSDVDFNNLYLQVNNLYTQNKQNTYSLLELEF